MRIIRKYVGKIDAIIPSLLSFNYVFPQESHVLKKSVLEKNNTI